MIQFFYGMLAGIALCIPAVWISTLQAKLNRKRMQNWKELAERAINEL